MTSATTSSDLKESVSTLQLLLNAPNVSLKYGVATASSWSGTYHPSNILHNRPHEMYSRWSGSSQHAVNSSNSPNYLSAASFAQQPSSSSNHGSSSSANVAPASSAPSATTAVSSSRRTATVPVLGNAAPNSTQKQYIILKLDRLSVVRSITFGKYHKPHPCNLRDFKVYGSTNLESLLPASSINGRPPASKRLLRGGLKNDANPETFELRWLEDAASGSGSGSSVDSSNLLPGEGEPDRRSATTALVNTGNAVPFAIRYLKIVPLAAHTPNYNFSIWHVALSGVSDPSLVSRVAHSYEEHRQSTTTRLILKHLREQGHHTAFQALLQSARLGPMSDVGSSQRMLPYSPNRPFEHPLLTNMFDSLVRRGNWDEVEHCLNRAAYGEVLTGAGTSGSSTPLSPGANLAHSIPSLSQSGHWTLPWQKSMFSSYISRQIPKACWAQILPTSPPHRAQQRDSSTSNSSANVASAPSGRGGHSMVFDADKGIVYLFGGWDGQKDLSDLWAFHVHEHRWRLISNDTRLQGGPSPRSCHKMCWDEKSGCIYLLGRYIDYEGHPQSTPADSVAAATRPPPSSAGQPPPAAITPSSSTARTTRANFLARYPDSIARDVQMIMSDPAFQTDDMGMEGAGVGGQPAPISQPGTPSSRHARANDSPSGSTHGGAVPDESSPLLGPSGEGVGRSPRPSSRLNASSRSTPQQSHASLASPPGREADFFRFSTRSEKWERLSADTYSDGGPKLIYDHGLVVDPQNQMIYVFGGRVTDPDPGKYEFSGMWRYDIIQRTWTFLFDDRTSNGAKIPSRSGHSMLLDSGRPGASGMSPSHTRQIWILGGQRGSTATLLPDMYTYNLATGAVREISKNTAQSGPEAAFTQRATIDVAAREISVFVGLIGGRGDRKRSAFWIYSIPRSSWRKVYQYEGGAQSEFEAEAGRSISTAFGMEVDDGSSVEGNGDDLDGELEGGDIPESGPLQALPTYSDDLSADEEMSAIEPPSNSWAQYSGQNTYDSSIDLGSSVPGSGLGTPTLGPGTVRASKQGSAASEPRPRYAAQLVFDERKKVYYLHGGNPEDPHDRSYRLDDFWKLTLLRPTPGEILRRAKFRVRRQRFLEMTRSLYPGFEDEEPSLMTSFVAGGGGGAAAEPPRFGLEALMYLQTEVGAVVDHSDETESKMFRRLMSHLLNADTSGHGGGLLSGSAGPLSDGGVPGSVNGEGSMRVSTFERGTSSGGALSSPIPPTNYASGSDHWAAAPAASGSKRLREEIETDEGEMEGSVSSLMSGEDTGSEMMMSASQVLQSRTKKASLAGPKSQVREEEGRPSALYMERTKLFRDLIEYFNPELVEPRAEIGACIEVALGG